MCTVVHPSWLKISWDPATSLSCALKWAAHGSAGHRDYALDRILSRITQAGDEDFRQDIVVKILLLIDGGKLDPSMPHSLPAYVGKSVYNMRLNRYQREVKKDEVLAEYKDRRTTYPKTEERTYHDKNLQAVINVVQRTGKCHGAIGLAAKKLGITRQTLRRRLQKLTGAAQDYS